MNLRSLLEKYNSILIPRIQRDYAQGRRDNATNEIRGNLLKDIFSSKSISFNMIFGESDSAGNFIPIDGQQRLTLLFLLLLYGSKTGYVDDFGVKKLNYSTRESTSEFWRFITDANWELDKSISLSSWCRNHNGYQWYWDMDPTVESMLVVLDDIHRSASKQPSSYPNIDAIEFDCHDMSQSGLNETLYLKMNSRGKHLNAFEKIKSALDQLVCTSSESYSTSGFDNYNWGKIDHKEMTFKDCWTYCMERDWIYWFWDENTASLDGTLLKLILAYTHIFISSHRDNIDGTPIAKAKTEIIDLIKKKSREILSADLAIAPQFYHITSAFSLFDNDEESLTEDPQLRKEYLEGLAKLITDITSANNHNFKAAWGECIDFANPELNYTNKTLGILASIIYFKGKNLLGKDFSMWLRFCWNMVENTVYDDESLTRFCRNCKGKYSKGSTNILTWLSNDMSSHNQDSQQLKEEIFKSKLLGPITMGDNTALTLAVLDAESHILNKGRIIHLITDENLELSHVGFVDKWRNFRAIFNSEGEPVDKVKFIEDYIRCADSQQAMSYGYDSEWSIFRVTRAAIKNKFNDRAYNSVWPYLFKTPLGKSELLHRDEAPQAELNVRKQLLIPGFIEAILSRWNDNEPRLRWYYRCFYLYPSGSRRECNYIMMDWYPTENNELDRKGITILNSLIGKRLISINEEKNSLLFHNATNGISYWTGKEIFFFYCGIEFILDKEYNLSIVSDNENNTTQSAIGISTDEAFIAILKNLKENYEEV